MTNFYFLTHQNNNPYFNLASEEYLLKHKKDYFIYLWINSPAVIVGVNQNTLEEVNLEYVEKSGVKVVRRLTGGGAVYHDLNNVCYTVIAPKESDEISFRDFSLPVIEYLKTLGINAEFSGRNDITIDGKKISGTAQTVWKDRVMHHGTLLFDTDVNALTSSLKPNKFKIESKGIKSVRARVTNLKEYLPNFTCQTLKNGLEEFLGGKLPVYTFNEQDINQIERLIEEKYSKYEWNFGYSPKGEITYSNRFEFGTLTLNFNAIEGKIQNAHISGDFFSIKPIEEFCQKLNGVEIKKEDLIKAFFNIKEYVAGACAEEIVNGLF